MNRKLSFFGLIVFFICFVFQAEAQKIRKYSNEFLNIGVGGSAMGVANTRTSTTNDLYSFYYNPAGLTSVKDVFQLGYMHSEYFAGVAKYDYFGAAVPIDSNRTIGFSFIRFGIDDIPNTLFLFEPDGSINYNNITKFTVADYAMYLTYAQKINKVRGLSVGGNVKVIHKNVGPFAKAWGFGIDLGLKYDYKKWHFGLMAKDITSTYNAWSFKFTDAEQAILVQTNNEIPSNSVELTAPSINLGASYTFDIKNKFFIEPMLDFNITTDGKRNVLFRTSPLAIDARFGLELNYAKIVYLRTGIGNFQWEDLGNDKEALRFQPSLGVGVNIKNWFYVDYAFTNIGNKEIFYSHVISAHFALQKRPQKNI